MSSNKYHKMAIDIIANYDFSALAKICVEIAKNNPATFVKAAKRVVGCDYKEEPTLAERASELVKQNRKVAAIKLVRAETGMGLKEAKSYVDSL